MASSNLPILPQPVTTTAGSPKARDIALLRTAFRRTTNYNNVWTVMNTYNSHETDASPLATTWTHLSGLATPLFSHSEITTSPNSPHSPSCFTEATRSFNAAIDRLVIYERNALDPAVQPLLAFFHSQKPIDNSEYLKTIFLVKAFKEQHLQVVDLTGKTWNDFFAAWAELEIAGRNGPPVFQMAEGMTHEASPVVTNDWEMDFHGQMAAEFISSGEASEGLARGPTRGPFGWG